MTEIIRKKIDEDKLKSFLGQPFDDMIKFVVDLDRKIIALGGEMHSDQEQVLLDDGSQQKDLWGGNVYPNNEKSDKIEYASLINIRPSQDNRAMEVQDEGIKNAMKDISESLLPI